MAIMAATSLSGAVSSEGIDHHGPWPYTYGWTIQDVGDFIRDIGFPHYVQCFKNNTVNGQQLACLTVYDLQRFGVARMEDAIRIAAYIRKAVNQRLYSYDNPSEPPRHSYLKAEQYSHLCPTSCSLPQVNKPMIVRMTFDDFCLPKRDLGGQYNRCHYYPGTPFHKLCHITPFKADNLHPWARRTRCCLPCRCCSEC